MKVFTIVEADQILATIYAANEGQIPESIVYPTFLASRDLMIAHLFIFLHGLVTQSLKVVGLSKLTVWLKILFIVCQLKVFQFYFTGDFVI